MKYSLAILLGTLLIILFAFPRTPHNPCMPFIELARRNYDEGYGFTATAVKNNTQDIALFLNKDGGWKIDSIDYDLNACEVESGEDWHFIWGMIHA
jgi:hypothetical protein